MRKRGFDDQSDCRYGPLAEAEFGPIDGYDGSYAINANTSRTRSGQKR